jgi:peptidyl-prolyl cis-trans isomerase D
MLRGIHKASSTWLGKAVMGTIMLFLIVSFAVWGIGDIFRGGGRNEVAKIGGTEITTERFRQYYNERLRQVSQQLQRPITPDQARALGLDRQFLGQLIAEATLSEKARDMRLGISDAEVASHIRSDPGFRGPNGQFDPSRFAMILNQAGFSEARFVAEQREVTLRRQIAQSISLNLRASATGLEVVDRYRNQKRNVDYLTLGPAQAGDVAAPTPEQLSQYFE